MIPDSGFSFPFYGKYTRRSDVGNAPLRLSAKKMISIKVLVPQILVSAALLQGCDTTPIRVAQADPVPSERVLSIPKVSRDANSKVARITITRDAGFAGSGPSLFLSLDGEPVAYFRRSETLSFDVQAGEHIVSVIPSPSFGAALREFEVHISPGAHNFYRLSVTTAAFNFQRTLESQ